MAKPLHIAIDGPVAAGKGTVASLVAKKLGILYIESGAMYRTVALLGMREQIDLTDEDAVFKLLQTHEISLVPSKDAPGVCLTFLDGQNVTDIIHTPDISRNVALVAKHLSIRSYLVKKQREIAKDNSVIMEGRDIGSVVLPNAQVKVFLTADSSERAKRRQKQLAQKGITHSFKDIEQETKKRDDHDMNRKINPLHITPGATVIDTTKMTIDEVVDAIISLVNKT
jgi:cytidylate kinase